MTKLCKTEDLDSRLLEDFFFRLSDAEQNRINRKRKRKESIAARFVLNELLISAFGEDLSSKISSDEKGRPHIVGRPEIFLSLSHSNGMVAAAVSDRPIGIDIEPVRSVSEKLKKRICGDTEITDEDFFRVWTGKEAYLKAAGIRFSEMLSLDLGSLEQNTAIKSEIVEGFMLSVVEIND